MDTYYLQSIILEGCPYSTAAHELLKNIPKSKSKITIVNYNNKENYKTDNIQTFPQIYLKRQNHKGSLLIGGNDELQKLFKLFYKTKYSNNNKFDETIKEVINNNNNWSKKSLLRFIDLIN